MANKEKELVMQEGEITRKQEELNWEHGEARVKAAEAVKERDEMKKSSDRSASRIGAVRGGAEVSDRVQCAGDSGKNICQ